MGIGPDTLLRNFTRSRAATVASLHEPKPNVVLSLSAVLREVSFGLPRLLIGLGEANDSIGEQASFRLTPVSVVSSASHVIKLVFGVRQVVVLLPM